MFKASGNILRDAAEEKYHSSLSERTCHMPLSCPCSHRYKLPAVVNTQQLMYTTEDELAKRHRSYSCRPGFSAATFRSGIKDTSEPLECVAVWSLCCAWHVPCLDLYPHIHLFCYI